MISEPAPWIPRLGTAGQLSDLAVDVEQLVGQLPDVREPALRDGSLAVRHQQADSETRDHDRCGGDRYPVAPGQLSCTIPGAAGSSAHRARFEEGLEIVWTAMADAASYWKATPSSPRIGKLVASALSTCRL
jgi:hypothetical protein